MKDSTLKYLEIFKVFEIQANEVRMSCKVSQRACEALARRVGQVKAKTGPEFEKIEALKEFITTTSVANEKMIDTLSTVQGYLMEIASDCDDLVNVAKLKDKLKFQSDTIDLLLNENHQIISLRDEIRRRNTATA